MGMFEMICSFVVLLHFIVHFLVFPALTTASPLLSMQFVYKDLDFQQPRPLSLVLCTSSASEQVSIPSLAFSEIHPQCLSP